MPNYCQNYLTISGNKETLIKIKDYVSSDKSVFDFNCLIPVPDISDLMSDNKGDGYDRVVKMFGTGGDKTSTVIWEREPKMTEDYLAWLNKTINEKTSEDAPKVATEGLLRVEHWGTSRCSIDPRVEFGESLKYSFSTLWDPCRPIVEKLAAMFPEVRIVYKYFLSSAFCGREEYEHGARVLTAVGYAFEQRFDDTEERPAPGITCTTEAEHVSENGAVYSFLVSDTDSYWTLRICGVCFDAREELTPFEW